MRAFLFLTVAIVATGPSVFAQLNISDAGTKAKCEQYLQTPLPAEASLVMAPKAWPDCASYELYVGIGTKVDFEAARKCAWKERAAQQADIAQSPQFPTAWAIGGDVILVNLYANGLGVPRNLPLAMRLACEEKAGVAGEAVADLNRLAESTERPSKRFEVCDSATTTFSMNFCGAYHAEIAAEKRRREFDRLSTSWTAEQKEFFAKLESAEENYVNTHVKELDQSGTIRGIANMDSQEILHHNFLLEVRQFERGDLPAGTATTAKQAELQMQQQVEDNMATARKPVDADEEGTAVTAEGIAEVQTAWKRYREAWVDFAASKYTSTPAYAFRTYFTRERWKLLKAMQDQIYRPG